MRRPVDREKLHALMEELARAQPKGHAGRIYFVGGGTAVWSGWRDSTVDVDLHGEPDSLFRNIQEIKGQLGTNVEFARPEDFVPALAGSDDRHVFIEKVGGVSFYHHDPYAQAFSKIVRGFDRDLKDVESFLSTGMVEAGRLRELVHDIPAKAYAKYPALSQNAVVAAVDGFLEGRSLDRRTR
jgi:hypothetical protein